jgi:S1-C subfamily serine protease
LRAQEAASLQDKRGLLRADRPPGALLEELAASSRRADALYTGLQRACHLARRPLDLRGAPPRAAGAPPRTSLGMRLAGAQVQVLLRGGPAARHGGVRVGDRVVAVDGVDVDDASVQVGPASVRTDAPPGDEGRGVRAAR